MAKHDGRFIKDKSVDFSKLSDEGTSGQVLTSNGAGQDPTWQSAGAPSSEGLIKFDMLERDDTNLPALVTVGKLKNIPQFNATGKSSVNSILLPIPRDWNGTSDLRLYMVLQTTGTAGGDAYFTFSADVHGHDEALDGTPSTIVTSKAHAISSTSGNQVIIESDTLGIASGNVSAGDTIVCTIERDADNGGDTNGEALNLLGAGLIYNDATSLIVFSYGGSTAGFILAGRSDAGAPSYSGDIKKFLFDAPFTVSTHSSTSIARTSAGNHSYNDKGFLVGGWTGSANSQITNFFELTTFISIQFHSGLASAHAYQGSVTDSANGVGFIIQGRIGASTADTSGLYKIDLNNTGTNYSSHGNTAVSSSYNCVGYSDASVGFARASYDYNTAGYTDLIEKFTYSAPVSVTSHGNLGNANRDISVETGGQGCQSSTHGFDVMAQDYGIASPYFVKFIDKWNFSGSFSSTSHGELNYFVYSSTVCNEQSKCFIPTGYNTSSVRLDTIQSFDHATNTNGAITHSGLASDTKRDGHIGFQV